MAVLTGFDLNIDTAEVLAMAQGTIPTLLLAAAVGLRWAMRIIRSFI